MPNMVRVAADVPAGNLAVISPGGSPRLALSVEQPGRRYMLLLTRTEREPERDFSLLRMDTSRHKALDLGAAFLFDYDPATVVLADSEIREDTGSLLIVGSQLLLVGKTGSPYELSQIYIDVKQGVTVDFFPRANAVEVRSWRLLLNSEFADTAPRELICWP